MADVLRRDPSSHVPRADHRLRLGVRSASVRREYGSVVFISGNMPYKATEIAPILIVARLEEFAYGEATAIARGALDDLLFDAGADQPPRELEPGAMQPSAPPVSKRSLAPAISNEAPPKKKIQRGCALALIAAALLIVGVAHRHPIVNVFGAEALSDGLGTYWKNLFLDPDIASARFILTLTVVPIALCANVDLR